MYCTSYRKAGYGVWLRTVSLICLLFSFPGIHAQERDHVLTGRITYAGQPHEVIQEIAVFLPAQHVGVFTDEDGVYEFTDILPGKQQLVLNNNGKDTFDINIKENGTTILHFMQQANGHFVIDTAHRPIVQRVVKIPPIVSCHENALFSFQLIRENEQDTAYTLNWLNDSSCSCEFRVLVADDNQVLGEYSGYSTSLSHLFFKPGSDSVKVFIKRRAMLNGYTNPEQPLCYCDYTMITIPVINLYKASLQLQSDTTVKYLPWPSSAKQRSFRYLPVYGNQYYYGFYGVKASVMPGHAKLMNINNSNVRNLWGEQLFPLDPFKKYYDRKGRAFTPRELAEYGYIRPREFMIDWEFRREHNFWMD